MQNHNYPPTQGSAPSDVGASRNDGYYFTSLTPSTASTDEMWLTYLDLVKDEDKRVSDAWKEDSTGILVFVSPTNLLTLFVSMTNSKDRSFFRNC